MTFLRSQIVGNSNRCFGSNISNAPMPRLVFNLHMNVYFYNLLHDISHKITDYMYIIYMTTACLLQQVC